MTLPKGITDDKLRETIVSEKLVTPEALREVDDVVTKYKVPLREVLIEQDPSLDKKIGEVLAKEMKLPFINISEISIPEEILFMIPENFARRHKVIIFAKTDGKISMAMADPTNNDVVERVRWKTGCQVKLFLATAMDIDNTLQTYKQDLQKIVDQLLREESRPLSALLEEAVMDAPIIKIVDAVINAAYKDKTSDIHIEPEEKESLVRFRIDGILHDILRLPKSLHDRVLTRIKVLSDLRTDEHHAAQDGKLTAIIGSDPIDIRVSIIPIVEGEKAVLRLLASKNQSYSLTDLGMSKVDLDKIANAFSKSYGMILSTGPTGSGKTTSIYSVLKILNKRERNITTIEDPVEYRIFGANQVQVNAKTNLTFANGLRSILRQDPNIIFVGEIRDNETASIAVNAALTGHLVFSTLHTNDAATAIPRLTDMKVEPFLVASTVNVIIAQRLVRKICQFCKNPTLTIKETVAVNISDEKLLAKYFKVDNDGQITVYEGKGCKFCHFTGYAGRLGVFEVLEVTKKIRQLITEKKDADVINQAAIDEGMVTMLEDGLLKISQGLTTIEEVLRVVKTETT
ncbi:MAG: GspE/PulE family protein [bacterium]|nr:GspE/PulE family protein [bacterium]